MTVTNDPSGDQIVEVPGLSEVRIRELVIEGQRVRMTSVTPVFERGRQYREHMRIITVCFAGYRIAYQHNAVSDELDPERPDFRFECLNPDELLAAIRQFEDTDIDVPETCDLPDDEDEFTEQEIAIEKRHRVIRQIEAAAWLMANDPDAPAPLTYRAHPGGKVWERIFDASAAK